MNGGHSSEQGILLYSGEKAVFGYYEDGAFVTKKGKRKELRQLQKSLKKDNKKETSRHNKIMVLTLMVFVAVTVIAFIKLSFLKGLMILIYMGGLYMPVLIILFTVFSLHEDTNDFQQFRRYHGAEHAAVKLMGKDKELTLENIKSVSYYDSECGTAYAGYFIALWTLFTCLIVNVDSIGLLKLILIMMGAVIILFINIFNPFNPFLLLQRKVVAKPSDREYKLALNIIEKLKEEDHNMLFIEYPKCSTCKKAKKWLDDNGIQYVDRHIKDENPTYDELKEWYERSGLPLKKFFNTSGMIYRDMQLKDKLPAMSEEEQLQLLATDGMLVKRPLIVKDDLIMTGFKEKEWEENLL